MKNFTNDYQKIGAHIEQIRHLKGIKQDTLAKDLGISRQLLSRFEHGDALDDQRVYQIAAALDISIDTLINFDSEIIIRDFFHTFSVKSDQLNFHFHPIEQLIQLYEEQLTSYKHQLESEKEKIELLKQLLNKKRGSKKS